MTAKDHANIRSLYFVHRFTLASVARLYGVSHTAIQHIIHSSKDNMIVSDINCLICGLEEIVDFYFIDGNETNHNPQNVIMLCEADKRKFAHLRKRVISQS